MKTIILTILLTATLYPQTGKSVLTQAQKDSISAMISDSLATLSVGIDTIDLENIIREDAKIGGLVNITPSYYSQGKQKPIISFVFDNQDSSITGAMRTIFIDRGVRFQISFRAMSQGTMDTSEYLSMQAEGFEIASHINRLQQGSLNRAEVDYYLDSLKTAHESLGFNIKNGNWLSGVYDPLWLSVVPKYYRSVRTAAGSQDINTMPINQYYLAAQSMDEGLLNTYKTFVDSAINNNAWMIFYGHTSDADNYFTELRDDDGNVDAGGTYGWQKVAALIDYIKAKTNYGEEGYIEIMNVDSALNYFSNAFTSGDVLDTLDNGDDGYYFRLSQNGKVEFNRSDALPIRLSQNTFTNASLLSSYPKMTSYMYSLSQTGFPTSSGVLTTFNNWLDADDNTMTGSAYQLYKGYGATSDLYIRHNLNDTWGSWYPISATTWRPNKEVGGKQASELLSTYESGYNSIMAVTTSGWGYPQQVGLVMTNKLDAGNSIGLHQWFFQNNANAIYFRGGTNAVWKSWVEVLTSNSVKELSGYIQTPALTDTLFVGRIITASSCDSMWVKSDDSVTVQIRVGNASYTGGTAFFSPARVINGEETITSFTGGQTLAADSEIYLYFTGIGDTTKRFQFILYYR